jgi:hypothetical protein
MRPVLHLTAMENFRGQSFSGRKSFDLNQYSILEMHPIETFPHDVEKKKTKTALQVKVRKNDSGDKELLYCSEIKIENQ